MDTRLLGKPGDSSVAQDAWRDKGYAGAAVPRLQKLIYDAAKAVHDLGGRRSGSVGTALLDDAHYLQGCSSQYRVPGRRQRRSRGLARVDREVRAEDEHTFCRTTDVHPDFLTSR